MPRMERLRSGAELRVTGPAGATAAVVCVNGGQGSEVEGTWSASLEWLVAPARAALPVARVRRGAIPDQVLEAARLVRRGRARRDRRTRRAADAPLGFSMGGAVAVQAAEAPSVETVLGLAPWFPDRLSLEPLRGRRLRVLHGSLDRWLPGIPGVSPASSRRGFERARALGVDGEYTLIPGAVHGVALRAHWGRALPLPRAAHVGTPRRRRAARSFSRAG